MLNARNTDLASTASPYILGFSDSLHDRSACLFRGAEPIVAIEEERLSRVKHGLDFYQESRSNPAAFAQMNLEAAPAADNEERLRGPIDYCLQAAGITIDDVGIVAGNSLHTFFPFRDRALFINHHVAHACSTFFASGFEDAAVLVCDGYGDAVASNVYETVLLGYGRNNRIRTMRTVSGHVSTYYDMQNSLGVFYRIGTLLSGFGIFDEGKAMGLSAYGRPVYREAICRHITYGKDVVQIDNGALWRSLSLQFAGVTDFDVRADIAATFQDILNEIMLFYAVTAHRLSGATRLCIAGGVGINCVANAFVLAHSPFKQVFVCPMPGDNGISFGAATFAAHSLLGLPRQRQLASASFGRRYDSNASRTALAAASVRCDVVECAEADLVERVAELIAKDEIVMWFQGGAELGPRALGNRSILANPATVACKDYINSNVKFREAFRPLAPIVLEEDAQNYFDLPCPSPFMLFAATAKPAAQRRAPGIVHVDGTARVQTLNRACNARLHALISRTGRLTGLPIVLNTSLNQKDLPIAETPEDALAAFLQSPVRYLVMDDFLVTKRVGVGDGA